MKTFFSSLAFLILAYTARSEPDLAGFVPLFNGRDLQGWHISARSGHSAASQNQSGGRWVVENGALTGAQDVAGNGGLIITDESYGDFEVVLEMNNDFGPDSGLFLRSTEDGKAWQAMIDYHANGNLMGIYGEGLGAAPSVSNFKFLGSPREIQELISPVSPSLPVLPQDWPSFWRHGEWNQLRARIAGNPPHITTWINGVRFCEWQESVRRHPDTGGIALQVHGGGDFTKQFVRYRNIQVKKLTPKPDNTLTDAERQQGWRLLFDGRTHAGWMNSDQSAPRTPVEDGALNPHRAGHYMLVHTQQWENFHLTLDFRITPHCNSGVFVRTRSLTARPGKDVGFNGLEIAIDDTLTAGFVDTGAVYDLAKPSRNAMRPVGEWNHLEIRSEGSRIEVMVNEEKVNSLDLSRFTEPNRRPDGTPHKFDVLYRDHPRLGYIGLQDHGSPCWYKNIKLKPLP